MLYDPKWEAETTVEPWRRVLLDAADLLERDGHCKGTDYAAGKRCAIGALVQAQRSENFRILSNAESLAWEKLSARVGRHIPDWNDAPERTAAEVIATMREVARS